jgi:hypothetical protein
MTQLEITKQTGGVMSVSLRVRLLARVGVRS